MPRKVDIKGCRFGSLVVIREDATRTSDGKVRWECRCDCGAIHVASGRELRNGKTKRCRACRTKHLIERGHRQFPTTHGMSDSPEYRVWCGVIRRCTDPTERFWKDYGGRGIKVCQRWLDSFQAFYDDMGPRPAGRSAAGRALYSIERRDVEGDYCPENCYWATNDVQARNRTDNVWVTYQGERMCLKDAATRAGLKDVTVIYRIRRGWPEEHWFEPLGFQVVSNSEKGRRAAMPRVKYWVDHEGERVPLSEAARRMGISYPCALYRLQTGKLL